MITLNISNPAISSTPMKMAFLMVGSTKVLLQTSTRNLNTLSYNPLAIPATELMVWSMFCPFVTHSVPTYVLKIYYKYRIRLRIPKTWLLYSFNYYKLLTYLNLRFTECFHHLLSIYAQQGCYMFSCTFFLVVWLTLLFSSLLFKFLKHSNECLMNSQKYMQSTL